MTIPIIATVIRVLWVALEYLRQRGRKVQPTQDWDKHSAQFWDLANAIEPVGMILGFSNVGGIQTGSTFIESAGLALLLFGIVIRWTAIHTLGKYFSSTVLIKDDHQLVRTGWYAHLRHPAYAGALVAHLGLGMAFANWFSIACSSVPYFVAAIYRMHVEEQALSEAFGQEYADYSRNTKRLIPKLY